jgi:hypothetical protein
MRRAIPNGDDNEDENENDGHALAPGGTCFAPQRRESVCYMLWVVAAVVVIGGHGQVVVVV